MERLFTPEERADEHYERAFGQVEVGYQPVDDLEFVAGVDENSGVLCEYRGVRAGQRGVSLIRFSR